MKSILRNMCLVLSVMCIIAFASPLCIFATSLDDLSSSSAVNSNASSQTQSTNIYGATNDSSSISDYLKGYTPVTDENMKQASAFASPIVSALGTLSGVIVMLVSGGIFVITALDLAYIGLPFTRAWLNPSYAAPQGGGSAPMPSMNMGYGGMRGGMMGGMMGAGMPVGGQTGGAAPEYGLRRKWISDEADYCVNTFMLGGQQQAQAGGMPMTGGMPMMGAPMPQQPAPAPMSRKSVIFEYLKKRIFFLVIFSLATVVLMSSLFTDCGLNLAELLSKIVNAGNAKIANTTF